MLQTPSLLHKALFDFFVWVGKWEMGKGGKGKESAGPPIFRVFFFFH